MHQNTGPACPRNKLGLIKRTWVLFYSFFFLRRRGTHGRGGVPDAGEVVLQWRCHRFGGRADQRRGAAGGRAATKLSRRTRRCCVGTPIGDATIFLFPYPTELVVIFAPSVQSGVGVFFAIPKATNAGTTFHPREEPSFDQYHDLSYVTFQPSFIPLI